MLTHSLCQRERSFGSHRSSFFQQLVSQWSRGSRRGEKKKMKINIYFRQILMKSVITLIALPKQTHSQSAN